DYLTVVDQSEEEESFRTQEELDARIKELQDQMRHAAANLEFEFAAQLRDSLKKLRKYELGL
ncbi:MAG: UvrB/UvrC motif-containing protein, partial [Acidobacteriota bacterium]|nr:UvrB/UvrC motif-containing protein [Acidobacteriota bacterium]